MWTGLKSIYLSIAPVSVYLSVCLSVCLPVGLSVCLSVRLSVHLSYCPFVWPSVCLSVCLAVRPSVCLFICLSVYLSLRLSKSFLPFAYQFFNLFIHAFFHLSIYSSGPVQLSSPCNHACNCSGVNYVPVCGGPLTFFSPCHAGCGEGNKRNEVRTFVKAITMYCICLLYYVELDVI